MSSLYFIFSVVAGRVSKEFEAFPEEARLICLAALTIAAAGGKPDIAKPMHGMGFWN